MHALSRNHEEEIIYMYRYIAHKNQQHHNDALVVQSSQCFAQFYIYSLPVLTICAWRSLPLFINKINMQIYKLYENACILNTLRSR